MQEAVREEEAPGYSQFVPPEQEMSLAVMERTARARKYNGRWELRAHGAQILANARAYHLHSPHGSPGLLFREPSWNPS